MTGTSPHADYSEGIFESDDPWDLARSDNEAAKFEQHSLNAVTSPAPRAALPNLHPMHIILNALR
ncbi:hypothetical protein M2335_000595 [Sphingobium sp. B12D2B]|nr:hypothetical protein [Sphingobium sp. B12D2B]